MSTSKEREEIKMCCNCEKIKEVEEKIKEVKKRILTDDFQSEEEKVGLGLLLLDYCVELYDLKN
jgi:hypothetical protein